MRYNIIYSCVSHIGKVRSMNQDNFICDGSYMKLDDTAIEFPLFPLPCRYSSATFFLNSKLYFATKKPTSQSLDFLV